MKANEPTNPWLDSDIEQLRALVADNVGNVEISKRLGRSVLSVKSKINRLGMPARIKPQKSWPPEETAQLLRLRDECKLGWSEIAKRLGRASGTCHSKYTYVKNGASKNKVARPEPVSAESHREWLRRMSLSPANLTAALLGDPLPGYSALDKRSP
jgi:transposase